MARRLITYTEFECDARGETARVEGDHADLPDGWVKSKQFESKPGHRRQILLCPSCGQDEDGAIALWHEKTGL